MFRSVDFCSSLRRFAPLLCGVGLLAPSLGCATNRAGNGALAGSLVGAGLGAAVGEAHDNPLAGALIGGLGGAALGSSVGGEIDRAEARAVQQAAHLQAAHQQAARGGVGVAEVIDLTLNGVDPEVIATHVRQNGGRGTLGAGDLITLQQNGVHPRVIAALQTSGPPAAPVAPIPPPRERVIIEEYHHGPGWSHCDPYCAPPPCYPRRFRRRPRRCEPGLSLGFHFD